MGVKDMAWVIVTDIEDTKDASGLEAAQERYRAWFISTTRFSRYKAAVDNTLTLDGYGDCIVTA